MRKKLRIFAAVMAVFTAAATFTSCGGSSTPSAPTTGETQSGTEKITDTATAPDGREKTASGVYKTGFPIVDDGQVLRVMVVQNNPDIAPQDTVIHQEIEAATGVKIEWECIPATSWKEKKGLLFATGNLPDVILNGNFTDAELLSMADAGQILPLNDFIQQYGEHLNAAAAKDESLMKDITAPDGNIYGLPRYLSGMDDSLPPVSSTRSMLYINKKWLDKLGLAIPSTTEEFKAVLQAFKEQDPNGNGLPDEVGISVVADGSNAASGGAPFDSWFGAFGLITNDSVAQYRNIIVKDGKVAFAAVQPEYKEAIKYFNELWNAGLIDVESFTQDNAMWSAKLKNPETRTVGAFHAWRGTAFRLNNEDDEYVIMPPLTGPDGDCLYPQYYFGVQERGSCVITSACENPDLAMRWLDNLMEPMNTYQFWTRAKIGYSIEMNAEGTQFELIEPQPAFGTTEYNQQVGDGYGLMCITSDIMKLKPADPDPFNVDNEIAQGKPLYTPHFPEEYYPNAFLSLDEAEIISSRSADISEYVKQMYAKWITEGGIDKDWDAYIKVLNDMGLEEYLAQYQAALDRYNNQ